MSVGTFFLTMCFHSQRYSRSCMLHASFNRRLGGAQPGNCFVSFSRAYARSGCSVELDLNFGGPLFSLFPFGRGELSLSPFYPDELSFFPAPPPKPPFQL